MAGIRINKEPTHRGTCTANLSQRAQLYRERAVMLRDRSVGAVAAPVAASAPQEDRDAIPSELIVPHFLIFVKCYPTRITDFPTIPISS